jgi:hypothetical protein
MHLMVLRSDTINKRHIASLNAELGTGRRHAEGEVDMGIL